MIGDADDCIALRPRCMETQRPRHWSWMTRDLRLPFWSGVLGGAQSTDEGGGREPTEEERDAQEGCRADQLVDERQLPDAQRFQLTQSARQDNEGNDASTLQGRGALRHLVSSECCSKENDRRRGRDRKERAGSERVEQRASASRECIRAESGECPTTCTYA